MVDLTESDLIELHGIVESRFKVFQGIKDPGLVKAITERPSQKLYGTFIPFDTIFTKAASIMEGIIRMHPFYDGNKRTALLAVIAYLELNGYSMVLPLSAVSFSVKIAKIQENDPETNAKLILKIAKWINKLSAKTNSNTIRWKSFIHFILPLIGVLAIFPMSGFVIRKWMAYDVYPEYQKESKEIVSFLVDITTRSVIHDLLKRK